MNLDTFFEKFDQFADAPNAIVKMRELVIQLAIQGKLVEQDQNDEPAADIIKRARSLALGIPKLAKSLISYDDRGLVEGCAQFELPTGWAWTCNLELGDTRPRNVAHDESLVAFAPMKRVPTDYRATLELESRPWGEIKKGFTHFADGDIAVAKITPCFQNGKACVMANLLGGIGAGTTELHVLRPHPNTVIPLYMLLFFKSPEFVAGGVATFSGTAGQQRVSNDYFRTRPIPLPPLPEQKRIVAKVDELMALCDRLETQQQERDTQHAALARASLARFADAPTPANLDFLFHKSYTITPADLRKSILTLAVQGKLVPQDPNDEPVESLAPALVTKSESSKGGRDAPFELPNTWRWMRLGQVSELINGDRSKNYPNKAEYVQDGVAWINTGHIQPDGTLSTDSMHYITREKFDSLRSGKVRPGDLVYCLRGATLGKTAIITQFQEGAVASSLVIIRLATAVEPRFAYGILTSPMGREQIFQFDNGSAQPNLSANSVKKYWVPIPPLAEQRRIVAKVDQLMTLVDELKTQLAASEVTAKNLLEALVAELTTPQEALCLSGTS